MTDLKGYINLNKLPKHIGIIMDGNGRWAVKQGKERVYGHQHGIQSVREVTEACTELGVAFLTLYAFSIENWNRPKDEIQALFRLLIHNLYVETPTFQKNNIRLNVIGDVNAFNEETQTTLKNCLKETANNTGLTLTLALSYSARWEITEAVKNIVEDAISNKIKPEDISAETISNYLTTKDMPDPELIIRTSGEYRISNFLLWQAAYAEFYFTSVLWPDFNKQSLYEALIDFQKRERRFGLTTEQIHK